MKKLLFLIAGATLALAQNSDARSMRLPSRVAVMEIQSATGVFTNVKSVILAEKGFEDNSRFIISIDGQTTEMTVNEVKSADCGSKRIVLKQKIQPGVRYYAFLSVDLVDHTFRVCEDYRPYLWEAKVTRESLLHHEPLSEMTIVGNPKSIPTTF